MGMTTRITARIRAHLTGVGDLAVPAVDLDLGTAVELVSGTGLGAADLMWSDSRTLAASTAEDLDLAGSLAGPLGGTLTFARIKAVLVRAAAGNTNTVEVTRPAANGVPLFLAAGDGLAVPPGGVFLWVAPSAAGVVVTAGTGDLLHLANGGAGTPVNFDVVILGASA